MLAKKYSLISSKTKFPTVSKVGSHHHFYLLDYIIDYFQDLPKFSLMQMFLALSQKIWHHLLVGKFSRVNLTEDKMLSEFRIKQNLIWRSSFPIYVRIGLFLVSKVFSFHLQSLNFLLHFSWLTMIININVKPI